MILSHKKGFCANEKAPKTITSIKTVSLWNLLLESNPFVKIVQFSLSFEARKKAKQFSLTFFPSWWKEKF